MASNVKFYRLGLESPVSRATYESVQVPGAIVFAIVAGEEGSWDSSEHKIVPPSQYIWANGVEYKVANADALTWVLNQVKVLEGSEEEVGSIDYKIKKALEEYELTAEKFMGLVDQEHSSVKVGISDSSLTFNCDGGASEEDVTAGAKVGYVDMNTVIPEGTTIQGLIEMIFTKTLGLSGATAPTNSIKLSDTTTKEIGSTVSLTATATFADGSWKNENNAEGKAWGAGSQKYGCTASEYNFSGMAAGEQASNTIAISDYTVKASNTISVTTDYTKSVNVPVNSKGEALTAGTINNSTTYKPQAASTTASASASFTGKYKWFIGTISGTEYTADDIRALSDKGWVGDAISCSFNDEGGTHPSVKVGETLIVAMPATKSLTKCTTLMGANALPYFTIVENYAGVSLDGSKYKLYVFSPEGANTIMENFVIR